MPSKIIIHRHPIKFITYNKFIDFYNNYYFKIV